MFKTSNVNETLLMVLLDRTSTTLPLMKLEVELSSSLAGSMLSIEANVITVIDCCPPSDSCTSIPTEELKSSLKVSVNVVLFKRIKGVSISKDSFVRLPVMFSRDSNNVELTLSGVVMSFFVAVMLSVSLVFRNSHEPLASSLVRTPAVRRTS